MSAPGTDERGSALLLALSVLTVLTVLTTMCLMTSGADLLLAGRMYQERRCFYAAESALGAALREWERARPPLVPPPAFAAPWPPVETPPERVRDGDWEITRSLGHLPDTGNADGDEGTTVVLFNRAFGYSGSPLEEGGYPVFQVRIAAAQGELRQALVAEVAAVTCAPAIDAAWTAGGPLALEGAITVSGASHGAAGEPDAGTAAIAGVISRGAVVAGAGVVIEGLRGAAGGPASTEPDRLVPETGLQALNAGESLLRLDELVPPPAGGDLAGIAWSRGDYSGSLDGEGILLVHNPGFLPRAYEASRRAVEEGVITPDYEPTYSHLDPAHQPASLRIIRRGAFRGVVVADTVGACDQEFTLTGALITLSRSPMRLNVFAPLRVLYSPAAVRLGGRGPLRHVTAFRPLPGTAERAP